MPFLLSNQNVFQYLIDCGLCTQQEESLIDIELKPAKNFNLLVTLPDGRKLLIKQERYNQKGKTLGEFVNEWRIHDFLQNFANLSHIRPLLSEALHFDADNSIIVFNYLNDYRDLADFYSKENIFPTQIAASVGRNLASIHRLTFDNPEYGELLQNSEDDFSQKTPKLSGDLDKITPRVFGTVPANGLKFFALYQRYDSLAQAIADLSNAFTPSCLTHNDLKLNNILLSLNWEEAVDNKSLQTESIIRFIDWERNGWGDPANDLGTLISSYLQIWLYSMITSKTIAIEESLRLATTPLERLQPSIAALLNAYLANFPEILELRPDFLPRVVQFCGLALIIAIQAALQHEKAFGNSGICMLQVAKSLLCRPEVSIPTVFGIEASNLRSAAFISR